MAISVNLFMRSLLRAMAGLVRVVNTIKNIDFCLPVHVFVC